MDGKPDVIPQSCLLLLLEVCGFTGIIIFSSVVVRTGTFFTVPVLFGERDVAPW